MQFKKVFGVGLNKSGTTSLGMAFQVLGFRHKPWSPTMLKLHLNGQHKQLFRRIAPYESFEDWPWPLMLPQLIDRYGDNARYVLTRRTSSQKWLDSLTNHASVLTGKSSPRTAIYGYAHPRMNEQAHLDFYENHLVDTRALFARHGLSHCLIELCWEEGDGWAELAGFLGKPALTSPFPHLNASPIHRKGLRPDARRLLQAFAKGHAVKQVAQG